MKKILLIIAIVFCIFQMVVLAVEIDIGSAAIDRPLSLITYTYVEKNNPANATGKITSIEIWANVDMTGCEVATFYVVSGDNLSTRDTHTIGNVTAGSKQTFSDLDINVQEGDYIGIYFATGKLDYNSSGGVGVWFVNGDKIPCSNQAFTFAANWILSLYGTGTTIGWPHKWNTITIGKWNTKEFTKWNDLE